MPGPGLDGSGGNRLDGTLPAGFRLRVAERKLGRRTALVGWVKTKDQSEAPCACHLTPTHTPWSTNGFALKVCPTLALTRSRGRSNARTGSSSTSDALRPVSTQARPPENLSSPQSLLGSQHRCDAVPEGSEVLLVPGRHQGLVEPVPLQRRNAGGLGSLDDVLRRRCDGRESPLRFRCNHRRDGRVRGRV